MIVRTRPPAATPPRVPIERIELVLGLGDFSAHRTYRPAEGMDLDACIAAIANPEHGVLGATAHFADGTKQEIPLCKFAHCTVAELADPATLERIGLATNK